MHTWEGLFGYARKGKGRQEYREFLHNVSPLELEEGERLMRQHGSALKHRVALTQHNIFERAVTYRERGKLHVSMAAIVFAMIGCGQFYFDAGWAVPAMGQGMDSTRAEVVWLSACKPFDITPGGVVAVLFRNGAEVSSARLSFAGVPSAEVDRDDAVLLSLVEQAREKGVSVGSLVDSRPAVRDLLYERNTQLRQRWRPAPQPSPVQALHAAVGAAAAGLRAGEQLRWHGDVLLNRDQPVCDTDMDSDSDGAS
jgi:hypothetical protein